MEKRGQRKTDDKKVMKQLNTMVTADFKRQMEEFGEKTGLPPSVLVRRACQNYMELWEKGQVML